MFGKYFFIAMMVLASLDTAFVMLEVPMVLAMPLLLVFSYAGGRLAAKCDFPEGR